MDYKYTDKIYEFSPVATSFNYMSLSSSLFLSLILA